MKRNLPKAMARMLDVGEAIDIRQAGKEIRPGLFEVEIYLEGKRYCDAKAGEWVYSIVRGKLTGKIYAAMDGRFECDEKFECLYMEAED